MDTKTHDAKDPDAVLHFAQELDHAPTEGAAPEAQKTEAAGANESVAKVGGEQVTSSSPAAASEKQGAEVDEDSDDDPGLVARMTAKGALFGF